MFSTRVYKNSSADKACLCVGGRCNLTFVRQPGQKSLDFRTAQVFRVLLAMKENECLAPMNIGMLGAHAVAQISNPLTQLIEQSRRLKWRYIRRRNKRRVPFRCDGASGLIGVQKTRHDCLQVAG